MPAPAVPETPAVTRLTTESIFAVRDEEPSEHPPESPSPAVATVATPPSAPQPKHPAWLTARAESLGLHPLLADRLDTGALTQVVLETLDAARRESADAGHVRVAERPAHGVATVATPPAPASTPEFDWGEHDVYDPDTDARVKRKVTDADLNPAIVAKFKEQAAELREVKAFLKTLSATAQNSAEQKRSAEFDRAFSKTPQVFGDGPLAAFAGKPEADRRIAVYNAVRGMFAAMPEAARAATSIEAAVEAIGKSMYPAALVATVATPPTPGTPASLAAPTQRQPSARPPGVERAREAVAQWWADAKSNGQPAEADTDLDEFLR